VRYFAAGRIETGGAHGLSAGHRRDKYQIHFSQLIRNKDVFQNTSARCFTLAGNDKRHSAHRGSGIRASPFESAFPSPFSARCRLPNGPSAEEIRTPVTTISLRCADGSLTRAGKSKNRTAAFPSAAAPQNCNVDRIFKGRFLIQNEVPGTQPSLQ
jgi:hypothetical protein